jgi:hypothetical protein
MSRERSGSLRKRRKRPYWMASPSRNAARPIPM